jgi:hypothetical protein
MKARTKVENAQLWSDPAREELLADLTQAAYGVTLRHGFRGSFLEVELELWRVLREVLARRKEVALCER